MYQIILLYLNITSPPLICYFITIFVFGILCRKKTSLRYFNLRYLVMDNLPICFNSRCCIKFRSNQSISSTFLHCINLGNCAIAVLLSPSQIFCCCNWYRKKLHTVLPFHLLYMQQWTLVIQNTYKQISVALPPNNIPYFHTKQQ